MTVPSPLRVAVVGCGAISKEHLQVANRRTDIRLVGVCDRSPAAAAWTAERHGSSAFTDVAAMLAATQPHIVHVLTTPASHVSIAATCLEAGSHVLVEKPIAPDRASYDVLAAEADRRGLLLLENHNYLFNDAVLALDALCEHGDLGEIVDVDILLVADVREGRFADELLGNPLGMLPGSTIRDFLTHMVYLGLHPLSDRAVTHVSSRWRNTSSNATVGFDDFAAELETRDARVRLRFDARLRPECFRVTVRGTRGTCDFDLFQPFQRIEVPRGPAVLSPLINHARNGVAMVGAAATGFRNKLLQHTPYHGLHRFVGGVYDTLLTGAAPPITAGDIANTLSVIDSIVADVPDRAVG